MASIGRIEKVDLREVWPHEAYDFTRWLGENLDLLSEELGIDLADADIEQSAGDFSVDVVAKDVSDRTIIIENQLERSDHDHLGKLLTYFAMMNAEAAIWIVSEARPEHVSAVSWLNENSEADFYLVQVEAIRIGDSPPAPLLTRIVGPSPQTREARRKKRELSDTDLMIQHFYEQLLERAEGRDHPHSGVSAKPYRYLNAGAGRAGFTFEYFLRRTDASVSLVLYRHQAPPEETLAQFRQLESQKAEIEREFGEPLDWDPQEGTHRCRISKTLKVGGYQSPEEDWPTIQEAMIDAMIRLDRALRPHIDTLDV